MPEHDDTAEPVAAMPEATTPPDAAATSGAPPASSAPSLDPVAELERRIAELEQALAKEREAAGDYMNRWQRAQADFANFRRRQQQEQEQMQRFLATEAAKLVLPALDSFERAFATLPPTLQRLTWIDGIALVSLQLQQALQTLGIQPIAAEPGHPLDPARHEAIGEIETAEHPDGHIAAVVQRGYQVDGALLRPALVQVARPPRAQTTSQTSSEQTADTNTSDARQAEPSAPAQGPAP